ncbi:four helix bundle protein [Flavobacterium sp.]|jgi:four helix bundle protein|uniref:four helix bundle protein n=1 Tax=Flavobacterium sp. TaxID=239 RepID=UPI0022C26D8D|nr:four helix bundle protein [Flavobacterium sp.]MCZ8228208.1 four helix bundle protein [Flavobacterium sp.]
MRNFRDLEVWQSAVLFVKRIYTITGTFPSEEKFGLVSQINRCAVSIPSNIAEGCSRSSQKDFSRFLQISLGSAFELETQIEIAKEIGFVDRISYMEIIDELNVIQKRIQSLKKYVDSQV